MIVSTWLDSRVALMEREMRAAIALYNVPCGKN